MNSLKSALSAAMGSAAGCTNRCRLIKKIADRLPAMDEAQFMALFEQAQSTLQRDIDSAHSDFLRAKQEYESYCASIGEPAYATYNED